MPLALALLLANIGSVVTVERRLTLTVTATLTPGRFHVPSYGRSTVETRHMLLGSAVPAATTSISSTRSPR